MVRHWVTIAVTEAETRRERGREGRPRAALFYADDGILASSNPQWPQWAFTQLVGMFDRVGLNTNSGKTVSLTCRPCSTDTGVLGQNNNGGEGGRILRERF